MYFRLTLLLILLGMSLCISGCTGAREPEEVGYVIAVGIDKAQEPGIIEVSYQLATPKGTGSGEGGISAEKSAILSFTAPSLAEARNLLSTVIAPTPTLSQIKVLILGEGLAREGVGDTLGAAKRFPEYRGSMFVMVAKGTAKQFLQANKPIFDYSASKYYELVLLSGIDSGYYLNTSLHNFYIKMKSDSACSYATLVGINPMSGAQAKGEKKIQKDRVQDYIAGELPREGGNKLEYQGTAVFVGDKMVGTLPNTETRLMAILLGKFPHGFISVDDPLIAQYGVNVALRLGSKPKIQAEIIDGKAVINVKVLLEGEISGISSGINYEDPGYLSLLETQISQIFEKRMADFVRHTQDLNADVVGFGYYLRPCFQKFSEFAAYNWNEKYNQAQITVSVTTKIRRSGLMLKTYPIE